MTIKNKTNNNSKMSWMQEKEAKIKTWVKKREEEEVVEEEEDPEVEEEKVEVEEMQQIHKQK